MGQSPEWEGPGADPVPFGPPPSTQEAGFVGHALLRQGVAQVPGGACGNRRSLPCQTRCISLALPLEEFVTQGPMRVGVWCLGWSARGHRRPELAGALEGPCEGVGRGMPRRHSGRERPGLMGHLPGH